MRHQIQGQSECQLASIAILADKPLKKVRSLAFKIASEKIGHKITSWSETFLNYKTQEIVHELCKQLKLDLKPPLSTADYVHNNPKIIDDLPPLSKGMLILFLPKEYTYHAVAYKKYIKKIKIFDPYYHKPYTLEEYQLKEEIKNFKIKTICPIGEQ